MNQDREDYSGSNKNNSLASHERENRLILTAAASAIAKASFYICACVIAGMLFSTCQVDNETIVQCEESCGTSRGIKEVSAWSCTCNELPDEVDTPWVLPKK